VSDPVLSDPVIEETKKTISAKEISKWSMIIAGLWIAGLHLLKAFWGLISPETIFGLETGDIILSGVALAAIFTPVYFSIVLDKIKEIKLGGRN